MAAINGKCVQCKLEVGEKDHAITCDQCEEWMHCKCVGLSDPDYKKLQILLKKYGFLRTSCNMCQRVAKRFKSVNSDIKTLKENEKSNEKQLENQGKELEKIQKMLCDLVETTRKDMKELKENSIPQANSPSTSASSRNDQQQEEDDRKRRENNAILYNMGNQYQ